jgi:hypothetical protein
MISLSPYTIDHELLSLLERQQKPPHNALSTVQSAAAATQYSQQRVREALYALPAVCVCVHTITYIDLSLSRVAGIVVPRAQKQSENTLLSPPSAFVPPLSSDPAIPVYSVASGSHSSLSIHITIRFSSSSLVANESFTPHRSCRARE